MQMELDGIDPATIVDSLVYASGLPSLVRVNTSFVTPEAKAKLTDRFGTGLRVES